MVEQPKYKLLKTFGKVEIREYPSCIHATTQLPVKDRNAAFRRIASYIFGSNKNQERIPMTAPVIMSSSNDKFTMKFIMPEGYSMKNLPAPINKDVVLEKVSKRKIAVLGFSGFMADKTIQNKTNELLTVLKKAKIKHKKETFFMGYNSPWTLPFSRRNEVGVQLN